MAIKRKDKQVKSSTDDVVLPGTTVHDDVPEVKPPVDDVVLAPKPPTDETYVVAIGKSIACKKGVLGAGEQINADYLGGGETSLNKLIDDGYIVKG